MVFGAAEPPLLVVYSYYHTFASVIVISLIGVTAARNKQLSQISSRDKLIIEELKKIESNTESIRMTNDFELQTGMR